MQVKQIKTDFEGQDIFIDEIRFGEVLYLYIGGRERTFNDLSLAMPKTLDSAHLLGEKATDDLGVMISEITGKPVLVSYGFDVENERENARYTHVKMFLRKYYAGK